MKLFNQPRASGKSWFLMQMATYTNGIIVTGDEASKKNTKQKAMYYFKVDLPVYTISEFINLRGINFKNRPVYFDDVEKILGNLAASNNGKAQAGMYTNDNEDDTSYYIDAIDKAQSRERRKKELEQKALQECEEQEYGFKEVPDMVLTNKQGEVVFKSNLLKKYNASFGNKIWNINIKYALFTDSLLNLMNQSFDTAYFKSVKRNRITMQDETIVFKFSGVKYKCLSIYAYSSGDPCDFPMGFEADKMEIVDESEWPLNE